MTIQVRLYDDSRHGQPVARVILSDRREDASYLPPSEAPGTRFYLSDVETADTALQQRLCEKLSRHSLRVAAARTHLSATLRTRGEEARDEPHGTANFWRTAIGRLETESGLRLDIDDWRRLLTELERQLSGMPVLPHVSEEAGGERGQFGNPYEWNPVDPAAEAPARRAWLLLARRRPVWIIALGAAASLLMATIWIFSKHGVPQPPARMVQQTPPTQEKQTAKELPAKAPEEALPTLAAFLFATDRGGKGGEQNAGNVVEVRVPPGGCRIRLDVQAKTLAYSSFSGFIQDVDGKIGFSADRAVAGRIKGERVVQVYFPSDKVPATGEYALILSGGPTKDKQKQIGRYVFYVTTPAAAPQGR